MLLHNKRLSCFTQHCQPVAESERVTRLHPRSSFKFVQSKCCRLFLDLLSSVPVQSRTGRLLSSTASLRFGQYRDTLDGVASTSTGSQTLASFVSRTSHPSHNSKCRLYRPMLLVRNSVVQIRPGNAWEDLLNVHILTGGAYPVPLVKASL